MTFEDLVGRATDFILHPNSQSVCFTFRLKLNKEMIPTSPDAFLLSILHISAGDQTYPPTICWSAASHVLRRHVMKKLRRGAPRIFFLSLLVILLFVCICILASLQITFHGSDSDNGETGFWLTRNTSHSVGLEHQLQFTKPWSRFVDFFLTRRQAVGHGLSGLMINQW